MSPLDVLIWLAVALAGLFVLGILVVVALIIWGAFVSIGRMRDDDEKDEVIIEGRSRS
jgi:hypothetical protein